MLKEITHAKAIEVLRSGGEIVIKRNPEADVKYKIDDNCLMWTTGNARNSMTTRSFDNCLMLTTGDAWSSITTRTLADFLAEPVYIEAEPFTMSFERDDLDPAQSLWYLLYTIGKIDWFVCDVNYQIKISKQTYKPIDMGQVVINYHEGKKVFGSNPKFPDDILLTEINDDFKIAWLKNYNWFEQQTTTEVHEREFHEFTDFYPGHFCSGKCTITITEIEK